MKILQGGILNQENYVKNIHNRKLSIYDTIEIGDEKLWIPSQELQAILFKKMRGLSLIGYPLRTRSKIVKSAVCEALGYPTPKAFKKTKPSFPGQQFDTYTQKRNNLQIWNADIEPTRRYVIFQVSEEGIIINVKVTVGQVIALLDKTGTLTQKYQARLNVDDIKFELFSESDTHNLVKLTKSFRPKLKLDKISPIEQPATDSIIPINEIFNRLKTVVGLKFPDTGADQERNRGAELHKIVCRKLGYKNYADSGQFPDVKNQLLEVKLQTSPTIDLGLIKPDSTELLDINKINGISIRHCDARYAIFYAKIINGEVEITNFY